jgi:hypothetical protein
VQRRASLGGVCQPTDIKPLVGAALDQLDPVPVGVEAEDDRQAGRRRPRERRFPVYPARLAACAGARFRGAATYSFLSRPAGPGDLSRGVLRDYDRRAQPKRQPPQEESP